MSLCTIYVIQETFLIKSSLAAMYIWNPAYVLVIGLYSIRILP